ncbi:MAG TPA: GNAT family N-acetyltransferase [Gaiellaceae bacterium]|jgi:GNAT superfamily N-acetyltransferase|nr:GNAT family N-acetyltransferase [Gaiellaceae bacterium]
MKRDLGGGYELDDSKERIELAEVHRFLSEESYWAKERPYETQEEFVRLAVRVVGLYHDRRQVGFCRAAHMPGLASVYLADVYILEEHRGRGLGEELVREMIDNGPFAGKAWTLHTGDMHPLYRKFGFDVPSERMMERPPGYTDRRSTSHASESG